KGPQFCEGAVPTSFEDPEKGMVCRNFSQMKCRPRPRRIQWKPVRTVPGDLRQVAVMTVRLVPAHGGVFVFLLRGPGTVQFRIYGCFRPGYLVFERRVPAEGNQGSNNHEFSQKSHNV